MEELIDRILRESVVIAVVGLSPNPERDSHEVARYLQEAGYRIIPVNPNAEEILGERCYPDLASVDVPIDLVDIFRRPQDVPPVVEAAIARGAKFIWMQLGIVNEEAAERARAAGIPVVMDRCTMIEHRARFGGWQRRMAG